MNLSDKTCSQLIYVTLMSLLLLFGSATSAFSFWHTILNETFEQNPDDWPWETDQDLGQSWSTFPSAKPPPPAPKHTWAVEESTVWRVTYDGWYRALFSTGLPNDIIPAVGEYPNNQYSWAFWGPFNINEDQIESGGTVFVWADIEDPWWDGAGDGFLIGISNNQFDPSSAPELENWCIAYNTVGNGTSGEWVPIEFSFDQLDSAGNDVSYMPDENGNVRLNCYLAFIFQSNNSSSNGTVKGLGVFLDDLSLGYDDGLFDYKLTDISFVKANDETQVLPELLLDVPFKVKLKFKSSGVQLGIEASHTLMITSDILAEPVYDTLKAAWNAQPYGITNTIVFSPVVVPEEITNINFEIKLDALDDQIEADELNNDTTFTKQILQAETPPEIEWLIPGSEFPIEEPFELTDTHYVDIYGERSYNIVPLKLNVYNSPDYQPCELSVYYDKNNLDFDGNWIQGATGIIVDPMDPSYPEVNIKWNTLQLKPEHYEDPDTVWVYAVVQDFNFPPVGVYAPYKVIIFPKAALNAETDFPSEEIPTEFTVNKAYPNPFNSTVGIEFGLPMQGNVSVEWYSLQGQLIDKQYLVGVSAGIHEVKWSPKNLASGVYLARISHGNKHLTQKVIYMK